MCSTGLFIERDKGGREGGWGTRAAWWLKSQPNHEVKSTEHRIKGSVASQCKRAAYTYCDRAKQGRVGGYGLMPSGQKPVMSLSQPDGKAYETLNSVSSTSHVI